MSEDHHFTTSATDIGLNTVAQNAKLLRILAGFIGAEHDG